MATPTNSTPPVITAATGTRVSDVLTASTGTWSGSPTSYSTRWLRCAADGSNPVEITDWSSMYPGWSTYQLRSADVGHTVRAEVTATNAEGSAAARPGSRSPMRCGKLADVLDPIEKGLGIGCEGAQAHVSQLFPVGLINQTDHGVSFARRASQVATPPGMTRTYAQGALRNAGAADRCASLIG